MAPRHARYRLALPLAAGAATAAQLAHGLATDLVSAEIRGRTVGYVLHVSPAPLLVLGYLFATVGSLLLSGDRRLLVLGILVGVGAPACWALWRLEFVSTWCAFAALCSVVLFGWVRARRASAQVPSGPVAVADDD